MFDWVFDVPLWIAGPALVVLLVGISLGGLLAVRSRVLPNLWVTSEDSHFVGPLVHSIMVFYGLVLALVAVNVFETYSESSRIVSAEATAIAMLYRDAGSYPEPARSRIQSALRDYVDNVIHEAWPLQRAGRIPTGGIAKMDTVQARLAAFEPVTEGQKALHAETWRAYNHVIEARRSRLDEVNTGLPGVMWLVVLLGAAISLSASFFFHVEDVRLHAILVALLATFIAAVLFLVLAMDHPFRGDLGISAESYQLIYDHLMRP
jgi:ABC-type multidrug transport system fused ATPase/permease subunit